MDLLIALVVLAYLFVTYGFWTVVFFAIGLAVLIFVVVATFSNLMAQNTPAKSQARRTKTERNRHMPHEIPGGPLGHIKTGLVIDEPWISKITQGEKVWEMRSTATRKRERIALIKKGSLSIVGVATISDVLGPFTDDQIQESFEKHQVPTHMIGKWRYAWVLRNVSKLSQPVNYLHSKGAVTFVTLDSVASLEVSAADAAAS